MENYQGIVPKSLEMLGLKAKDKVTGFEGTVSSVCFDLYGCVLVSLTPPRNLENKEGKLPEGYWFDIKRIDTSERVMQAPVFLEIAKGQERGAAEKPTMRA